jgi:hypothetical protein
LGTLKNFPRICTILQRGLHCRFSRLFFFVHDARNQEQLSLKVSSRSLLHVGFPKRNGGEKKGNASRGGRELDWLSLVSQKDGELLND